MYRRYSKLLTLFYMGFICVDFFVLCQHDSIVKIKDVDF